MAKIYLIRHGESVANTEGRYQGQSYNSPLSPLGQKQVEALGKHLANMKIDLMYVSPLTRTMMTAKAIKKYHFEPIETIIDRRLIETDHGEWEGVSKIEIEQKWPDLFKLWLTEPSKVEFPRGEKYTETARRAMEWFHEANQRQGTIVAVSHANIIQSILATVHNTGLDSIWQYNIHGASINAIETDNPESNSINDTRHIDSYLNDTSLQAI